MMNKKLLTIIALFVFGATLIAQNKAEVTVKIVEDGKVLKDTVYSFDDAKKAKHLLHMMEMMNDEEGKHKKMMFISEDGETKEIHEHDMHMHWTTEEGDSVKVVKVTSTGTGHANVWVSKDAEHAEHVVIHEDEEKTTSWTIKEGDNDELILISESGKKIELIEDSVVKDEDGKTVKWISGDDDDMKVIVIKNITEDGEEVEMEVTVEEEKEKKKKKKK